MEILTGTLGIEVVDDKDPQHSISLDIERVRWETLGLKPNDRVRCVVEDDGNIIIEKRSV